MIFLYKMVSYPFLVFARFSRAKFALRPWDSVRFGNEVLVLTTIWLINIHAKENRNEKEGHGECSTWRRSSFSYVCVRVNGESVGISVIVIEYLPTEMGR